MNIWGFCCFNCDKPLTIADHGFCSRCVKLLRGSAYCGVCGSALREKSNGCGNCLSNEPKWHRLVRVADYASPLSDWIHRFKFQRQYALDRALARLLLLALYQARREYSLRLPEVIFPVPLFWQRQWQRGFNQAELIARPLARWLDIPIDTQSLQRIHATQSQRELNATQRRHNLRSAFVYQPIKHYQRIALVDDVVTTGSTMNAICGELLKQGVEEIQVWTLARA